jgi:hypothetical protein
MVGDDYPIGHGLSAGSECSVGSAEDHCMQLSAERIGQTAASAKHALRGTIEAGATPQTANDV